MVHALLLAAEGTSEAYKIRGPNRLRALADEYGIPRDGRSDKKWPRTLGELLLAEFGRQDGFLINVRRAPEQQQKNWAAATAAPRGIDREVVTGMHMPRTWASDNDAEHLLLAAARTALADGWGGSMIATDVSDILFGEPQPLRSRANLGVLKADEVNILVHGHEPTLSDVLVAADRGPRAARRGRAPRAPRASTWPASAARPTRFSCGTAFPSPAISSSRNWPS